MDRGHEVVCVDDFSTGSLLNLAEARGSAGRALTIHSMDISAPAVIELMARRRPELVFHLAAYQDYLTDFSHFFLTNSVGTALLYELIVTEHLPIRKVVVASSQAVYNEGAYRCPEHGHFYGTTRPMTQLARGDFDVHCPRCGAAATPAPTDEEAPTGGENVYAISKLVQ